MTAYSKDDVLVTFKDGAEIKAYSDKVSCSVFFWVKIQASQFKDVQLKSFYAPN